MAAVASRAPDYAGRRRREQSKAVPSAPSAAIMPGHGRLHSLQAVDKQCRQREPLAAKAANQSSLSSGSLARSPDESVL